MKIQQYIFILIIFFSITTGNAQDDKHQKAIINKLNEIHKPTFKTRDSIAFLYKVINEKVPNTNDTIIKNKLYHKISQLDILAAKNDAKELDNELHFIKQYPSNKIALEILTNKITKREAVDKINLIDLTFNNLSSELKFSPAGLDLKTSIINLQNSAVGSKAPNFYVKDIKNNSWNLGMFKDKKYVLLTFGNNSSTISRTENVYLKNLYQSYNNKGLEIMCVSLDEDLRDLSGSIRYQKTDMFINIPLATNKIPILEEYFINTIPQKILIDKNGIIIGRWRGSSDANNKNLSSTLSKIFNIQKDSLVNKNLK